MFCVQVGDSKRVLIGGRVQAGDVRVEEGVGQEQAVHHLRQGGGLGLRRAVQGVFLPHLEGGLQSVLRTLRVLGQRHLYRSGTKS